jgi:hypothetical protein
MAAIKRASAGEPAATSESGDRMPPEANHLLRLQEPQPSNRHASRTAGRCSSPGLGEGYTCETGKAIPAQWQRFVTYLGNILHHLRRFRRRFFIFAKNSGL